MIVALEAHKLSTAKRTLADRARVIAGLANVERRVMLAIDRGEYTTRVPEGTLVASASDVSVALKQLGYSVIWMRKRKVHEAALSVSWGGARETKQ